MTGGRGSFCYPTRLSEGRPGTAGDARSSTLSSGGSVSLFGCGGVCHAQPSAVLATTSGPRLPAYPTNALAVLTAGGLNHSKVPLLMAWRRAPRERSRHMAPFVSTAPHRSSTASAALRLAARSAWVARRSGLLAIAAQRAFAATLVELPLAGGRNLVRDAPELREPRGTALMPWRCGPWPVGGVVTGDQTSSCSWKTSRRKKKCLQNHRVEVVVSDVCHSWLEKLASHDANEIYVGELLGFFFFLGPFCNRSAPSQCTGKAKTKSRATQERPRQSTEVQGGQGKLGCAGRRQASCS